MQTQTSRESSPVDVRKVSVTRVIQKPTEDGGGGRTPLGWALRRQRQALLCEFKDSLVYKASSKSTKGYTTRPRLFKKKKKKLLREDRNNL